MKRALLCFLLASTGLASAAIDFTPTSGERVLAGIKFPQLVFHEDGRRIIYEQPRGWNYTGGGPSIRFTPPDMTQTHCDIHQAPLKEPMVFDEPTLKALQQQALAMLPPGSLSVAIVSEEKNPLLLNGNETYEVVASYTFHGQEFQAAVIFANLPGTQLPFRTIATKANFEKVHGAFRGSLVSLQGLKRPGETPAR